MKTLSLILLLTCLICCSGCAAYNKTGWYTPDTANYTLSRDRMTGDLTDYWGLSWTLKDK